MIEPLVLARAVHFVSGLLVAGDLVFSVLIAEPVWQRRDPVPAPWLRSFRKNAASMVWLASGLAVASGAAHVVLVAAEIGGEHWTDVIANGTAWAVLTDTRFGFVSQVRLLLAVILAALLLLLGLNREGASSGLRVAAAAVAALFLGSLAWTGHATGASGYGASAHLVSDVAHILAAATWIGGLFSLALMMWQMSQSDGGQWRADCVRALHRFSNLGVASVATLLVSGFINTWFLTDHMRGLIGTDYGRLLQIKIGLFLAMIGLAAVNRFRLLPRLSGSANTPHGMSALRRLQRNTALEIAIGLAAVYVVAVLGVTAPAGHHH